MSFYYVFLNNIECKNKTSIVLVMYVYTFTASAVNIV